MTWLYAVNYFILQFFFFRLARIIRSDKGAVITIGWSLIYFIVPLTGWNHNYIYIGKHRAKVILVVDTTLEEITKQ